MKSDQAVGVDLRSAALCIELDCNTVFDGTTYRHCPRCGNAECYPVALWLDRAGHAPDAGHREARGLRDARGGVDATAGSRTDRGGLAVVELPGRELPVGAGASGSRASAHRGVRPGRIRLV